MNKRLCYFGFCLLLLTGCTSCKEQKEILIGTIGRIDTSRVTPVQDRLDSLKQAAARAVNKVPYLDSASKKIAIEPPYISADSLTMIRELWDSIVNDPLLGYFKVVFVSEDGTETEGYMHEDYILQKSIPDRYTTIHNTTIPNIYLNPPVATFLF